MGEATSNYVHIVPGSARFNVHGLAVLREKYAANDDVVSLINQLAAIEKAGREMRENQRQFNGFVFRASSGDETAKALEMGACLVMRESERAFDALLASPSAKGETGGMGGPYATD